MANRNPRLFDQSRPLVMARFATLHAHDMQAGDPLTIVDEPAEGEEAEGGKGEVTLDIAVRLWLAGFANYAEDFRPTPVETPEEEANRVVAMEDLGGGWYLIRAPWLGEGEKVQGKDAADARRAEIIAKGDTKGVTIEGGAGGFYTITAPWIDEPEKVRGKDKAEARADALIAEGPPEGWVLLTQEEKDKAAAEATEKEAIRQAAADAAEAGRLADQKAIDEAKAREEAAAAEAAAGDGQGDKTPASAEAAPQGDGTAVETPEAGQTFTATEGEDGKFTITGPDLAEPVAVDTKDEADAKVAELTAAYTEAHPATETEPKTDAEA